MAVEEKTALQESLAAEEVRLPRITAQFLQWCKRDLARRCRAQPLYLLFFSGSILWNNRLPTRAAAADMGETRT